MAINVDEIVSSVIPEPEQQSSGRGTGEPDWKRSAQMRALHALIFRDRMRTSAEGFDD